MPFAFDTRKRVAISLAAKLSAMDTTIHPERIIAKYTITAVTVIGMSIAIVSPFENVTSRAFATILNLMLMKHIYRQRLEQQKRNTIKD